MQRGLDLDHGRLKRGALPSTSDIRKERFTISRVVCTGPDITGGIPVHTRLFNLRSENVMADLCLGAAIIGIDTLIAVGLFIVFI